MEKSFGGGIGPERLTGNASGSGGGAERGMNKSAGIGSVGEKHSAVEDIGSVSFGSSLGPRFLKRKMPEYPLVARKQKKEGKVVLAITIAKNGCLEHIEVIEASDSLFVAPAIEAVKKSSFLPAIRDGVPITVTAVLPIRFALSN